MFISPAFLNSKTPKEYTNRARDEVARKLNLPTTNLKHGSSSLKIVTNASDTSLNKVNSNESSESIGSTHSSKTKKLFGFGNKLKDIANQTSIKEQFNNLTRTTSSLSSIKSNDDDDVQMCDTDSVNESTIQSDLQPLQPVPSIVSTDSIFSSQSMQPSIQSSKHSLNNSLFSNQNSINTQFTNISEFSYPNQIHTEPLISNSKLILTLQQALPAHYNDMYAPELLADPNLLIDGRPMFTKRDLLDWNLNDIRSLLIVEKLRPEWGYQIPSIYPTSNHEFKLEILPLDSDDSTIVETLVNSDIYKEAKFDKNFRIQTAKYTLSTARKRHELILRANGIPEGYFSNRLSKPEWRNIIENFLLNLAVEAQCRYDYKRAIHDLKKQRRSADSSDHSLLRRAILNDVSQAKNSSLTKTDKAEVWKNVQSNVYKRLGLDWAPDQVSSN